MMTTQRKMILGVVAIILMIVAEVGPRIERHWAGPEEARVVVLYDTKQAMSFPQGQKDLLTSADFRAWVGAHYAPVDGVPAVRLFATSIDPTEVEADWRPAVQAAKTWATAHQNQPVIALSMSGKVSVGVLPADEDAAMAWLSRGGK
jgi:hypothetical protein